MTRKQRHALATKVRADFERGLTRKAIAYRYNIPYERVRDYLGSDYKRQPYRAYPTLSLGQQIDCLLDEGLTTKQITERLHVTAQYVYNRRVARKAR